MVKRITILGATGSIGQSTIDVIRANADRFIVEALVGNSNIAALARDARALGARCAVTADAGRYEELKDLLAGSDVEAAAGEAAVLEAAGRPADIVMAAIVGIAGLRPTFAAARAGKKVLLANKEALVTAGPVLMQAAREGGARRTRSSVAPAVRAVSSPRRRRDSRSQSRASDRGGG